MRELERENAASSATEDRAPLGRLVILGAGRAGGALARAGRRAGLDVELAGRGARLGERRGETVLLCVPDREITAACEVAARARPAFVGHTSGASGLDALDSAARSGAGVFSLHPLQTIPAPDAEVAGAPCAVSGDGAASLDLARRLAQRLGLLPFTVPEERRAAYHAAAAIASNFLVALEESAAELASRCGIDDPRAVLAPLVLRSAANWSEHGRGALTGPIARGDDETVERHRQALAETAPELLPLYEALAERTRELARGEAA